MDIDMHLAERFVCLPVAQGWSEMHTLFEKTARGQPRHWQLPRIACEAVGGASEQAVPAVLAVACAHLGIVLIDDLLDEDPKGEYHRLGKAAAANLGAAFQVAALQAILHSPAAAGTQLAAVHSLVQMLLATALGQHREAHDAISDDAAYWAIVQGKSAPFFGTALHLGALLGGAAPAVAGQMRALGELYGEMIQVHDDLNDALATPANPDWMPGRSSLPLLFARVVDHPDRERFLALRQNVQVPASLAEAQAILIRCGAVSYCVDQLVQHYEKACRMLAAIPLQDASGVVRLLEEVLAPVYRLFVAAGVEPDALPPNWARSSVGVSGVINPS